MSDFPTNINSEQQALLLFKGLVGEENATLPAVDVFDGVHSVPWTEDSPIFQDVEKLETGTLTEAFKNIHCAVAEQLQKELTAGRITGAKYADMFLALTEHSLTSAVQFVLGKDQAFWMAARAQAEAVAANNQNESIRTQTMLARANYALTLLKLSTEDSTFGTSEFQRKEVLPAQKALLEEQREAQRAQTADTRSDEETPVGGVLGKQMELYAQQKESYVADTKIKATKVFADLWVSQRMSDPGTENLNAFDPNTDPENPNNNNKENFNRIFLSLRDMTGAPPWENPPEPED